MPPETCLSILEQSQKRNSDSKFIQVSPIPPRPTVHFAYSPNLAHKLAVRIACRMVRDRIPEVKAFPEVEACIEVTGSIPAAIPGDDALERQLASTYNWERALISDWVSAPRGGSLQ